MRHALSLIACLAAAPVMAQEAAAPTVVVAAGQPAKPRKVCRSEQVSGSLMPARTCHNAQEWADIDSGRSFDMNNAASGLILRNHVQGDVTGSTAGGLPRQAGH